MKALNVVEITPVDVKYATITIEGEGTLVLNKMNAAATRMLVNKQSGKVNDKKEANVWENIITSVHWRDALDIKDTYKECSEELYHELLKNNAPCITSFGLKKSFDQAVVRNEIDTYSTKFDNAVNIIADDGLIPVTFTQASVDERLMSPQKGSPVLVYLNKFTGWRAEFKIAYTDNVYTLNQIVNIIKLAGFGLGIGSGRTSGYGRYKVVDVK